jgi:glycosyltransferase involved in cell wall biosynthesis
VLSVVTPSYNTGRFIAETLDSVAALAVDHEHLVFDGGSDDDTVDILRGRDDPALRWVSESDRGQTHAVNKGLGAARGDFVAWLNADDAYVPGAVERALERFDDPGVGAVFGWEQIVDEHGAQIDEYRCGSFNWRRYLYFGDYIPTPTIIFRRALLDRTPALDERYKDAADYDFYLRLLKGERVELVREPLVRFRYHAESKTASNVGLQRRESMEIRRSWARSRRDLVLMDAANLLQRARNRVVSPWPDLQAAGESR